MNTKPIGFLFRALLLALFSLSLVAGAISTDYYIRHEVTRKAKRFLAANGVELTPASAIAAAKQGQLELLEKLERAGIAMGAPDEIGRTPLLAAVSSGEAETIDFLMERETVAGSINQMTNPERETPLAVALRERDFPLANRLIAKGAHVNADKVAGMPFLIDSIETEDSEMLRFLLENGVDVEYRGTQPTTALAVAANLGELEIMQQLVSAGASPDVRGISGKALLIESVNEQNRKEFDLLLEAGADVNATTGESAGIEISALSFAVANGNEEMQKILLRRQASPDVHSVEGRPLLFDAVLNRENAVVDRLLEADAKTDVLAADLGTPLCAAVRNEDIEMVDLLLSNGADPSLTAAKKDPPLLASVSTGNVAIAHQLIAAGAVMDKEALLARSYERRDDPLMSLLLNAGVDPESTMPGTDERVFDRAVSEGATGAVRTLLASGAQIGDNLWAALLTGQYDLIRLILDAGADPRQPGPEGQDPLAYCLLNEQYRGARELLAGGANPNARYNESESWLSRSVREGNADIALTLIESGAEVKDVKASDGHTLLGWAIAHEMVDVATALTKAGVDVDAYERSPSTKTFRDKFDSTTFRYHLQTDSRIRPIMMAAAQRNQEIAQAVMDAGAKKNSWSRKYVSGASIAAWYGDYRIQQIALTGRSPEVQPRYVVVDLSSQRVTLYENGVATYSTRCSTGKSGYRTPVGKYVISDQNRHHTSSIYHSSMPYFQRFSFSAFGLHQGYVPGYPASHGCIRLPWDAAKYLFGKLDVGDYAEIRR